MKVIDLTFPIEEGMPTFPAHWHPLVEISQLGRFGFEDRETRKLVLGTHTGTHIDAPRHFIPSGQTLDEIPLELLIGWAVKVDLRELEFGSEITVDHLVDRCKGLNIKRLILQFGGDRNYGNKKYYEDHSWLTIEAAQWLVSQGCKLLGYDMASPDNPINVHGSKEDSPIHKILLGNGVVLLEYLTQLDCISSSNFFLVTAPMKINGADGSPVRAFAIEGIRRSEDD